MVFGLLFTDEHAITVAQMYTLFLDPWLQLRFCLWLVQIGSVLGRRGAHSKEIRCHRRGSEMRIECHERVTKCQVTTRQRFPRNRIKADGNRRATALPRYPVDERSIVRNGRDRHEQR